MYVYPGPLDNPQRLAQIPGNFWLQVFEGADTVYDYLLGCNQAEQQLYQGQYELQDSVGRFTCPIFHTQNWYALTLNKSDGVSGSYPLPTEVAKLNFGTSNILYGGVTFTDTVDFEINGHMIQFITDPFLITEVPQQPVLDDTGTIIDYTIQLWFLKAQLDYSIFYQQFGYVVGQQLPSTQQAKDFINAVLNAWTSGTAYTEIATALATLADTPIVRTATETVEVIVTDNQGLLIVTDKFVYRFPASANPIVVVGQVVHLSDQLVDTVSIFEPYNDAVPSVPSVTLGPEFFDPVVTGPLTFGNSSVPLVVTTGVADFTQLSWTLGGAGPDVTAFFNQLHAKGVANGATLANYMDLRPQPQPTQPDASNLPTTINPMQFLFQNVLRANAFFVTMKSSQFGPNALGTELLDTFRRVIPPGTAMITSIS